MTATSIRSFVAVPLPDEIRTRIFAAAGELARELPGVRWSRKVENLHVTLKFLGDVPEEKLAALGPALAESVGALPRFRVELRRMGAFPSARHASVLWAWVDDVGNGLGALTEAVEATSERLGFPRERRPLTGHVTVGRSKRGGVDARQALDAFVEREFGGIVVEEIHLYESQLGGGPDNAGSTYVLRSRAALNSN
jgi:RNA 2',3'-cyclic 3'-phosphodiesterase